MQENIKKSIRLGKKYDKPKTPYRRIMESDKIPDKVKEKLTEEYDKLNPMELKIKINKLQKKLYNLYERKQKERKQKEIPKHPLSNIPNNNPMNHNDFVYNLSEAIK